MNLQSLFQDIINFWNDIAPLVIGHLLAILALIWISKREFANISEGFLQFFRSATYREWKHALSEFDLMPKIPLFVAIGLLIYLALLSNFLGVITSGFSNPLGFVHSDNEFWLETNDAGLTYFLIELAVHQPKPDVSVAEILSYRDQILDEYKLKYPDEYRSVVGWVEDDFRVWSKYYQAALAVFIVFVYILIQAVFKKNRSIHLSRLTIILGVGLLSIICFRYLAEQKIEQVNIVEMHFFMRMLRRDSLLQANGLSDEDRYFVECQIYKERNAYKNTSDRLFWISRWLDGYLPRKMTSYSEEPWAPPSTCP